MSVVLLALCIVALVLAAIELVRARGNNLLAWAVLILSAVLVIERVT